MPTANELLHPEVCDDILVVDLESRTIVIPKNVSVLGVEADDETRVLHFHVPRYYCNVDLSEFAIRINYKNANNDSDMYIVTDKVIENDLIKFDWVVGRNAFTKKGNVKFSVCLKDLFEGVVKREFNTTPAILPVLEGLETGGAIAVEYADVFEQMREELVDTIGGDVEDYFFEHVNEFKGPKGEDFEYEDFTPEQLADLVGPKGEPGINTVYVGAGDMPDDYVVQVDPDGEGIDVHQIINEALQEAKDSGEFKGPKGDAGYPDAANYSLPASDWELGENIYYQTIAVAGVRTDMRQFIMVDVRQTGEDLEVDADALSAWLGTEGSGPASWYVTQGDGTLTFHAKSMPTYDIPLIIAVGG